jgi:hypothetical protein
MPSDISFLEFAEDTEQKQDSSVVLGQYLHRVANGKMRRYKQLIQYGGKQGQTYYGHVMDLASVADRLRAALGLDEREMRESDERLRIGLKLFVGEHRKEWEERFVYRSTEYEPTALYGLQVIALNSSRGLDEEVEDMFKERYIPAFVAAADSRTAAELWNLQRQGQCSPYKLEVTFADLKTASYYSVLGTMALLVWAEILPHYRKWDQRKADADDDDPIII